ncbi:unnamed protein product, partial [Symbiodinium sp. CCMP2456]
NENPSAMADVLLTTFDDCRLSRLSGYWLPGGPDVPDEPGYYWNEPQQLHLFFRTQESMWVISHTQQRLVPFATSLDLEHWNVDIGTVIAPTHKLPIRQPRMIKGVECAKGVALYIFTFQRQLKDLSGCYQYFGKYNKAPCFKRWQKPQHFLMKSGEGLWVIRDKDRKELAASNNLVYFAAPDKSLEKASRKVVDKWREPAPQPAAPASSSVPSAPASSSTQPAPPPATSRTKPRVCIGYDMEDVRTYFNEVHSRGPRPLRARPDEDCDFKVIYEVFKRQVYRPSGATSLFMPRRGDHLLDLGGHIGSATAWYLENGIASSDAYEPTGTFEMLQENLGQESRVQLHKKAVVHETCSSETGGRRIKANAAFVDEWSDSVVVHVADGHLYLKEVGGYQTLAMATSFRLVPLGSKLVLDKGKKATTLQARAEAIRAKLPGVLEFFWGPDLLMQDGTHFTQTSHRTWRDHRGSKLTKPVDTGLSSWLTQVGARPCLSFSDYAGSATGSWKSSLSSCRVSITPGSTTLVPAISLGEALADRHTVVKMDIEGSELQLLAQRRDWKNTRLLIVEFSAGRCRRFGAGPLPFAGVLDSLKAGGFTHLHLERSVTAKTFWTRENNLAASLDFMAFFYRRQAGHPMDTGATARMAALMEGLPAKLRALDGYPQDPMARKPRGKRSSSSVAS